MYKFLATLTFFSLISTIQAQSMCEPASIGTGSANVKNACVSKAIANGKVIKNSIGIEFVWIPSGAGLLGSPPWEQGRDGESENRRLVHFKDGFWMGRFEVTIDQWVKVMGVSPVDKPGTPNEPVCWVSYDDCLEFCSKLNKMEGHQKYRLPLEDEWEYACRAGTRTAYCYGNKLSLRQANFGANADEPWTSEHAVYGKDVFLIKNKTVAVGSYEPNAWGLYDMHGNVDEWCLDWDPTTLDADTPPENSVTACRIFRGGSWFSDSNDCRSASRNAAGQNNKFDTLGFRLLLEKQ